ncbi:uncharacterized protein LOC125665488 isoform X1 [Ostrea edulis]|uniref:uncharacterized protein LOC125665488 isoform X1 n=1 Tax=Ostrea edulis TaxID=37623 RepID=UPI0024AE96D3|nr:uncharacterized protein LOC125665488 isoform X1 [Ostrea edulis]XP_056008213.1 uncharacterized protein LOC125665488 isoform X1 [Ostrea edulis]XP_056008214.1 uncharacterized protein LOC125665488 isoform X1 [Ostrea edulis]
MGNGASSAQLFVANDSGGDAWIVLTPSKDFPLVKYFAEDFGLSSLAKADVRGKSVADLFNFWAKGKIRMDRKERVSSVVLDFFKNVGLHLTSGFARDMYDKALCNPLHYLSAYGWGALNNSEELCITILVQASTGELKMSQFKTLSDWSWIVNTKSVTLTKGASLWEKRLPAGYPLMELSIEDK